jgi:uncharacterized membrane protein
VASTVVVLGFREQTGAEEMLGILGKMQQDGLIELEDAVVASRGNEPNVKIKQTQHETGKFALRGTGIGFLAGLLLGGPIVGLAGGAAIGAITGRLKDQGIDDKFVREVSEWVKPNTSALFLLVKEAKAEEIYEQLKSFRAQVLTTTLPEEAERRLRRTLAEEQ